MHLLCLYELKIIQMILLYSSNSSVLLGSDPFSLKATNVIMIQNVYCQKLLKIKNYVNII